MPCIQLNPPAGPFKAFYSISTPRNHDAQAIIPELPTILFIHPIYMSQQIFEAQFSDYNLRQFNLVALDLRSHGESEGLIGNEIYQPEEDVIHFMNALQLPPCHLFGLSIGGTVALELTTKYPSRVLSLTMCSPPAPQDEKAITVARIQVQDSWTRGLRSTETEQAPNSREKDPEMDPEHCLSGAILGIKQLAFNNELTPLTSAITQLSIEQAYRHWSGSPDSVLEGYRAALMWPALRTPPTTDDLAKIKCPIRLIYCKEDIIYERKAADDLHKQMIALGLSAELHVVSGPHYGTVAGASEINPVVKELVHSCHDSIPSIPFTAEHFDNSLKTPFDDKLEKFNFYAADYHPLHALHHGFEGCIPQGALVVHM